MKPYKKILTCLLACFTLNTSHAVSFSITDGGSVFSFDTEDTEGNADLTGTGTFAADNIYDYAVFLRIGAVNFELNEANTSSIAVTGSGSSQNITYNDVGANTGLSVTIDYSIGTAASGMPEMAFMGSVINSTGADLVADVIMYTDFDYRGTPTDSASILGDVVSITDTSALSYLKVRVT